MLTRCRACLLPVVWCVSVYGKPVALDPVPTPEGEVVLDPWDRRAKFGGPGYRIDLPHYRRHACQGKAKRPGGKRRRAAFRKARSHETPY